VFENNGWGKKKKNNTFRIFSKPKKTNITKQPTPPQGTKKKRAYPRGQKNPKPKKKKKKKTLNFQQPTRGGTTFCDVCVKNRKATLFLGTRTGSHKKKSCACFRFYPPHKRVIKPNKKNLISYGGARVGAGG